MGSIRIRTKVEGVTLVLPELKLLIGKTVDIEVTERPDEGPPDDRRASLAERSARPAGREFEQDAADVGMTVEQYLEFLTDLDINPLRVPSLSPAGSLEVTFVPAGRVRPLPLADPEDEST